MKVPRVLKLLSFAVCAASWPLPGYAATGMSWGSSTPAVYFEYSYPNMAISYKGANCSSFDPINIEHVPHECIYHALCDDFIPPSTPICFKSDKAPRGLIWMLDLFQLSDYCRKESICGYPRNPTQPRPPMTDATKRKE